MRTDLRRAFAALLFLYMPSIATASDVGAEDIPVLSWEDVSARIDLHPAMLAAAAELEAAAGEVGAARRLPNPELDYGRGRAEAKESEEAGDTWELALSLPIRPWGPYRHEVAAARSGHRGAGMRREALRLEVERRLKSQFWRIGHDQRRLETLRRSQTEFSRLLDLARLRAELGEARPIDSLRLEIEFEKLSAGIRAVEREAVLNRRALGIWLELEPPESFVVEADWDRVPVIPSLADLLAIRRDEHPSLRAADFELEGAAARLRAAQAERLPGLNIGAFVEQELDAKTRGLAMSVELPLLSFNGGEIARARAERAAAGHDREEMARELDQSLVEAHARVELAAEEMASYRNVVLPKSQEAALALERMYQVGEVGILDILDARRELIETEMEVLETILDFRLALTDLNALLGGESHE